MAIEDIRPTLHQDLMRLCNRHDRASLVGHALIELGIVTSIECSYEGCRQRTKLFSTPGSERALRPTVDHIDPDGTDDPYNLRLIHFGCNIARAHWKSEETQRKMAENPVYVLKRRASGIRGGKAAGKIMKEKCAERDKEALLLREKGKTYQEIADLLNVSKSCIAHVIKRHT